MSGWPINEVSRWEPIVAFRDNSFTRRQVEKSPPGWTQHRSNGWPGIVRRPIEFHLTEFCFYSSVETRALKFILVRRLGYLVLQLKRRSSISCVRFLSTLPVVTSTGVWIVLIEISASYSSLSFSDIFVIVYTVPDLRLYETWISASSVTHQSSSVTIPLLWALPVWRLSHSAHNRRLYCFNVENFALNFNYLWLISIRCCVARIIFRLWSRTPSICFCNGLIWSLQFQRKFA